MTRSGFISISGQPNVGKSTLINAFLKEKVAIVSRKPETTRDVIKGILTDGDCQFIFTDTPGFHRPHDLLGKIMVKKAHSSLLEADMIVFMTEKRAAFNANDMDIIARLPEKTPDKKVILVVNKVDMVKDKKALLPLMEKAVKVYPFDEVFPMCALKKEDVARLLELLRKYLPEGPFYYPEDQITESDDGFMIQEIIREKVLLETYEEVPHSVAVVIDHIAESEKKDILDIFVTIYVERTSQKSIIIGKKGEKLKSIGVQARLDIEKLLSRHVYLELYVKVKEKWKKDERALSEMGYS
jgi:GTP-binding protein Era